MVHKVHVIFVLFCFFWHPHVLLLADIHVYSAGGAVLPSSCRYEACSRSCFLYSKVSLNDVFFLFKDIKNEKDNLCA